MIRVFKYEDGCHMEAFKPKVGDHNLFLKNNSSFRVNRDVVLLPDRVRIFHYGHAKGLKDHLRKREFFRQLDNPEISPEDLDKTDTWIDERWFDGKNPDPKSIKIYDGTHPETMQKHPDFNRRLILDEI